MEYVILKGLIMKNNKNKMWTEFNKNKVKSNYPMWPNEVLVKIIFGNYLKNNININSNFKVLDVGCGFGNNLKPFLEIGCQCYGTEITQEMAIQTKNILKQTGYNADIVHGKNSSLPFNNNFFNLLISVNTIHYEEKEEKVQDALKEFNRVLNVNGRLVLLTVGPEHTIIKRSKVIKANEYEIQNYDFRDGTQFYCANSKKYLEYILSKYFCEIETGRVTEDMMTLYLDFLIGVCRPNK